MTLLALLLAVSLGPTAQAQQSFTAQRVVPPPEVVDDLRRVVILTERSRFGSSGIEVLANQLRTKVGFSNAPVADEGLKSDVIDFVTADHPGGVLSNAAVAEIAKRHDAQAVVTFSANGNVVVDEPYQGKVTRTRENSETGETESYEVNVPCQRRGVEADVSATLITAAGVQQVTVKRTVRDDRSDCDTDDGGPDTIDLPTAVSMINGLVTNQARQFARQWIPSWETIQVTLPTDAITRTAARMMASGDWMGAAAEAARILEDDPFNAQATMVAAAVLELHGRASDAEPLWAMSNRLRPNRVASEAQSRSSSRTAQLAALERGYGQKPAEWEQPALKPVIERARQARSAPNVGTPAKVQGSRNKRHPVYASADAGSMVIATLPGSALVRHIRIQGKFAEIQLPDGSTGWALSKSVKR